MKIDRNNYEMYFLNYLEGRLTAEETAGLLAFAEINPDLKELIEGEELISLHPDKTIKFHPKFALKRKAEVGDEYGVQDNISFNNIPAVSYRTINSQNYEEYIIRFYENDLNDTEQNALNRFLSDHPSYIQTFELFGNTLLKPDTGVIYPHKLSLKRKAIPVRNIKRVIAIVAVAASVLLFSTLFLKYIDQPIPREMDKRLSQTVRPGIKPIIAPKSNKSFAELKSEKINAVNNSRHLSNPSIQNTNPSGRSKVKLAGHEPKSKYLRYNTTERTTFKVLALLNIRQPKLLAISSISFPGTIERRADFDGIPTTAYYDPDPDALPLNHQRSTFMGRLGSTLAQGISQTAGTMAREPEFGRLLSGKFSLSDVAGLGIAGYNLITDRRLSISRDYDSDGKMKGHSLNDGEKRLTRLP